MASLFDNVRGMTPWIETVVKGALSGSEQVREEESGGKSIYGHRYSTPISACHRVGRLAQVSRVTKRRRRQVPAVGGDGGDGNGNGGHCHFWGSEMEVFVHDGAHFVEAVFVAPDPTTITTTTDTDTTTTNSLRWLPEKPPEKNSILRLLKYSVSTLPLCRGTDAGRSPRSSRLITTATATIPPLEICLRIEEATILKGCMGLFYSKTFDVDVNHSVGLRKFLGENAGQRRSMIRNLIRLGGGGRGNTTAITAEGCCRGGGEDSSVVWPMIRGDSAKTSGAFTSTTKTTQTTLSASSSSSSSSSKPTLSTSLDGVLGHLHDVVLRYHRIRLDSHRYNATNNLDLKSYAPSPERSLFIKMVKYVEINHYCCPNNDDDNNETKDVDEDDCDRDDTENSWPFPCREDLQSSINAIPPDVPLDSLETFVKSLHCPRHSDQPNLQGEARYRAFRRHVLGPILMPRLLQHLRRGNAPANGQHVGDTNYHNGSQVGVHLQVQCVTRRLFGRAHTLRQLLDQVACFVVKNEDNGRRYRVGVATSPADLDHGLVFRIVRDVLDMVWRSVQLQTSFCLAVDFLMEHNDNEEATATSGNEAFRHLLNIDNHYLSVAARNVVARSLPPPQSQPQVSTSTSTGHTTTASTTTKRDAHPTTVPTYSPLRSQSQDTDDEEDDANAADIKGINEMLEQSPIDEDPEKLETQDLDGPNLWSPRRLHTPPILKAPCMKDPSPASTHDKENEKGTDQNQRGMDLNDDESITDSSYINTQPVTQVSTVVDASYLTPENNKKKIRRLVTEEGNYGHTPNSISSPPKTTTTATNVSFFHKTTNGLELDRHVKEDNRDETTKKDPHVETITNKFDAMDYSSHKTTVRGKISSITFNEILWPLLSRKGWSLDESSSDLSICHSKHKYFLPPGVKPQSEKTSTCGERHFVDTMEDVIAMIQRESEWNQDKEIMEAIDMFWVKPVVCDQSENANKDVDVPCESPHKEPESNKEKESDAFFHENERETMKSTKSPKDEQELKSGKAKVINFDKAQGKGRSTQIPHLDNKNEDEKVCKVPYAVGKTKGHKIGSSNDDEEISVATKIDQNVEDDDSQNDDVAKNENKLDMAGNDNGSKDEVSQPKNLANVYAESTLLSNEENVGREGNDNNKEKRASDTKHTCDDDGYSISTYLKGGVNIIKTFFWESSTIPRLHHHNDCDSTKKQDNDKHSTRTKETVKNEIPADVRLDNHLRETATHEEEQKQNNHQPARLENTSSHLDQHEEIKGKHDKDLEKAKQVTKLLCRIGNKDQIDQSRFDLAGKNKGDTGEIDNRSLTKFGSPISPRGMQGNCKERLESDPNHVFNGRKKRKENDSDKKSSFEMYKAKYKIIGHNVKEADQDVNACNTADGKNDERGNNNNDCLVYKDYSNKENCENHHNVTEKVVAVARNVTKLSTTEPRALAKASHKNQDFRENEGSTSLEQNRDRNYMDSNLENLSSHNSSTTATASDLETKSFTVATKRRQLEPPTKSILCGNQKNLSINKSNNKETLRNLTLSGGKGTKSPSVGNSKSTPENNDTKNDILKSHSNYVRKRKKIVGKRFGKAQRKKRKNKEEASSAENIPDDENAENADNGFYKKNKEKKIEKRNHKECESYEIILRNKVDDTNEVEKLTASNRTYKTRNEVSIRANLEAPSAVVTKHLSVSDMCDKNINHSSVERNSSDVEKLNSTTADEKIAGLELSPDRSRRTDPFGQFHCTKRNDTILKSTDINNAGKPSLRLKSRDAKADNQKEDEAYTNNKCIKNEMIQSDCVYGETQNEINIQKSQTRNDENEIVNEKESTTSIERTTTIGEVDGNPQNRVKSSNDRYNDTAPTRKLDPSGEVGLCGNDDIPKDGSKVVNFSVLEFPTQDRTRQKRNHNSKTLLEHVSNEEISQPQIEVTPTKRYCTRSSSSTLEAISFVALGEEADCTDTPHQRKKRSCGSKMSSGEGAGSDHRRHSREAWPTIPDDAIALSTNGKDASLKNPPFVDDSKAGNENLAGPVSMEDIARKEFQLRQHAFVPSDRWVNERQFQRAAVSSPFRRAKRRVYSTKQVHKKTSSGRNAYSSNSLENLWCDTVGKEVVIEELFFDLQADSLDEDNQGGREAII